MKGALVHKQPKISSIDSAQTDAISVTQHCSGWPEHFSLIEHGTAIARTVTRRNGSHHVTKFSIAKREQDAALDEEALAALADQAFIRSIDYQEATDVRVVDLFAGCGIMSLGVSEACRALGLKFTPVLAVDSNAQAIAVYGANFGNDIAKQARVDDLFSGRLGAAPTDEEKTLISTLGSVDLLLGGPPCQGHSNLNNYTRRKDPKNKLYDRMARFAELIKPRHIIIENVPAVLHDKGRIVDETSKALERLGYHLAAGVVEATAIGVPQKRRRHLLIGSLERAINIEEILKRFARPSRDVLWAIGDLRQIKRNGPFNTTAKMNEVNQGRIDYLFKKGIYTLPNSERPDCHKNKEHSYVSAYGRMHPNKPAQTITTGFPTIGRGRFIHPTQRRPLTPHEAARLQFIPDFFKFDAVSSRVALADMIGNAVPSKVTYVLAIELLR
jgi:DNA (cytosine-5)-methyltransferase 1